MAQQIVNELGKALDKTIGLLDGFSQEEINKIPFKGSWSAAQVGRHLYKSEDGIDGLFNATAEPANRAPDQNAEDLKKILLDFDNKMESPDFIKPEEREYNKQDLIQSLKEAKEVVIETCTTADLTGVAPLEEGHPLKGHTKLELVHFMTYHTQRHNHQIEKIREIV